MGHLKHQHQLSSTHPQYMIISTSDPLKLKLKITGVCEKIHHHKHHHGGIKKSKHGHKHKPSRRELVDLTLMLGLFGKEDGKSMPTSLVVTDKIKNFAVYTQEEEEEEKKFGVSTKLALSNIV